MQQFKGTTIFNKVAIGNIFYFEKSDKEIIFSKVQNMEEEIKRFHQAKEVAKENLQGLYEKAMNEIGAEEAQIFEVHMMMLDDEDYCGSIESMIRTQEANAEYAVDVTGRQFAQMFRELDDEYMQARAMDILDISHQMTDILTDSGNNLSQLIKPSIVVADDLTPSETVQMDSSLLLGFVTRQGSSNSHTAILARTMSIPALINVEIQKDWHNQLAVLNGYTGTLSINPDENCLISARKIQEDDFLKLQLLEDLKGKASITKDGQKIDIFANIGSVSDVDAVLENDGEGIGLFRSEFLYLEATDYPTEEDQFKAYQSVVEKIGQRKVVIRTLDIGADKQVDYFDLDKEENPALGYRAIRICLTRPELFKTQLRALLRASAYGNLAIMFPMIISIRELKKANEILNDAKDELKAEGIPYGDPEVGIMIETPAAVLMSEELAQEVNFFSIGTNDLTQYTLAIDRQNPHLDDFYDAHHPAVLKMIQLTVENGHKNGIWVGICGELAADLQLTETFLRMGVDELSVSPPFILPLREKVRSLDVGNKS